MARGNGDNAVEPAIFFRGGLEEGRGSEIVFGRVDLLAEPRDLVLEQGASVYTASKHAVEGLTKSAALEGAAFGVRVNAVAPGPVETGMLNRFTGSADVKAGLIAGVPLKRAGRPEEIAQTIVFLASDEASFITGQIIGVDGGKMA
jgi:NAD(P)-dependent dehydrogenase (short-subunit alcohol dehydrogenase family)